MCTAYLTRTIVWKYVMKWKTENYPNQTTREFADKDGGQKECSCERSLIDRKKLHSPSHKIPYNDVIRNQIVFISSIKLAGVNAHFTYIHVYIYIGIQCKYLSKWCTGQHICRRFVLFVTGILIELLKTTTLATIQQEAAQFETFWLWRKIPGMTTILHAEWQTTYK